jgi:hypothetical protein
VLLSLTALQVEANFDVEPDRGRRADYQNAQVADLVGPFADENLELKFVALVQFVK